MVTGALVIQHHIVTHRNTHEISTARSCQQYRQIFDVILISFHVIGITGIDSHGQPREFAHEVIFQSSPGHLSCVVQIFRPDESDNGIDHERFIVTGQPITTGFQSYLVGAVVGFC